MGFRVDVADGQLNVTFSATVGQTMVNAVGVISTPVDGAGPPAVVTRARPMFGANVISWDRGSAPDLAGYQVSAAPSATGPWVLISAPVWYARRWVDETAPGGVPTW